MNEEISYPQSGHDGSFEIEDNSFWFKSRNKVIGYITECLGIGSSFVDVGGGNGYVSQFLKNRNRDVTVSLIEPGQNGCNNAQKRNIDHVYNDTIDKVDIKVDSLGLFDVIEHIEEPVIFLKDCKEKLNDNGKLYITVPAYNTLWSEEDIYAGHFRRYTLKTIRHELNQAGFEVIYSSYFFVFLLPFIFLLRSIPYKLGKKQVNNASNDHKSGLTGLIIEKILDIELLFLKTGITLPFGASIIICAKKLD